MVVRDCIPAHDVYDRLSRDSAREAQPAPPEAAANHPDGIH